MRISKLSISSLYGIKHLNLDGTSIELRGKKGAGKTSVIDSIRYCLTNRSERDFIVKQGETEGEILIETSSGVSINRRKRTEVGDLLKVTEFGKSMSSPQSFLNSIFTQLQLDPVAFSNYDKKTQNRIILDLIEFEWDTNFIKEQFGELPSGIDYSQHILKVLHDIQDDDGDYYKLRHELNKKELYKRQSASDIASTLPENYNLQKWKTYSLADRIRELNTSQENNSKILRAKEFIKNYNDKIRGFEAEKEIAINAEKDAIRVEREATVSAIERMKAEIKASEDKLGTLEEKLQDKIKIAESEYKEKCAKLDGDIKTADEYATRPIEPIEELQEEVANAEKMIKRISECELMYSMKKECEALIAESEELTRKITLARELPGIILETATIPVKGLSVKDGIPLINGLPISNLSNGERIELCLDVCIAKENNLQMILLDGMEALDEKSRNELYEKCRDKGLQVIATRTDDSDDLTIVELFTEGENNGQ